MVTAKQFTVNMKSRSVQYTLLLLNFTGITHTYIYMITVTVVSIKKNLDNGEDTERSETWFFFFIVRSNGFFFNLHWVCRKNMVSWKRNMVLQRERISRWTRNMVREAFSSNYLKFSYISFLIYRVSMSQTLYLCTSTITFF